MGTFYLNILKRAFSNVYKILGNLATFVAIIGFLASPIIEETGKWFSNRLEIYPGWIISSTIFIVFFIWIGYFSIKLIFEDQKNLKKELDNIKAFFEPKIEIVFANLDPYIHEIGGQGYINYTLYRIGIKNTSNKTLVGLQVQILQIEPSLGLPFSPPLDLKQMHTRPPYPTSFDIHPGQTPKFIDVLHLRNHPTNPSSINLTCIVPEEEYWPQLNSKNYEIEILVTGQNIPSERKFFKLIQDQETNYIFKESDQ